jgi:hypothetical protein
MNTSAPPAEVSQSHPAPSDLCADDLTLQFDE